MFYLKTLILIICLIGWCHCKDFLKVISFENEVNDENDQDLDQESRIFHGYVAKPRQFPHMCSLLSKKTNGALTLYGGSLISQKHILTSAACVRDKIRIIVGCGSNDRTKLHIQTETSTFVAHPQYDPSTLSNDIGILTLPIIVKFDSYVKPIRLPTVAQAAATFEGATATISGFGRFSVSVSSSSKILRYVNVRIVPNRDCASIYGSHVIVNSTVCALGLEFDEQGTCNGDGGSPLIIQEGTEKTQIAIASFVSSKGCGTNRPTGYVRTASYLFWISQITGIPVRYS